MERFARLYAHALKILDGRGSGFGEPILWHLALRGYAPAMLELANRATDEGEYRELGRTADAFSPRGMMYRAYRQGERHAAQNMAMSLFNIGDMAGYRQWIRRAGQLGDAEAAIETNASKHANRLVLLAA